MLAVEFGSLCFTPSASEQEIDMVIAPGAEYPSLQKFIAAALSFLERSESYKARPFLLLTQPLEQFNFDM